MGYYLLDYNPGTQQWGYPRRGSQLSGTCIIHTAECAMDLVGDDSSAEVCAHFIANRADYGSYHRLVDSDSIIEMLPWEYEAWQDSQTNPWAVGISAATQAGRWNEIPEGRREYFYRNMAKCAADFVRYMATKGITVPVHRITGDQARAGVAGFCAHGDSGVSRSDPGVQFDWDKFFLYTKQALTGTLQEDEVATPAQIDAIVHRVNTFAQANANDVAKVVINEVRTHTKFNSDRVLDALKELPQISDEVIDGIKAALDTEVEESVKRVEEKLASLSITLKAGGAE